jgi:N-succinyldiaminopimelate aminotransferase
MNPALGSLQTYPFEKLRQLFAGAEPPAAYPHISLGIGEPRHPTPDLVKRAIAENAGKLDSYPPTAGSPALREAIAAWIARRYGIPPLDPAKQVLPINGSREALFAFAQTVVDRSAPGGTPAIVCPNPFYQIYEGAAILAGAEPVYVNMVPEREFRVDYASVPADVWRRTQLLYTCSPGNPTGKVMTLDDWREVFALADRYGFVIASDECYSELYFNEAQPPIGGLEAAVKLGRADFRNLVVFSSLSKRSNVPGMRSGFVAGDRAILEKFLLYRTYHGSAMSPLYQIASVAAWQDEAHVVENRRKYAEKFRAAFPLLGAPLETRMPEGGFYFWVRTPIPDTEFARRLYAERGVTVLPGSYLARVANGVNPGEGFVRIALVAEFDECLAAVRRLADFARAL